MGVAGGAWVGWALRMQSPHRLHPAGLTPLHTAILALNVAMHPPDLCSRVLSTQARDGLACVQMLLHMGADHTSQVSWAVGSRPLGGCVGWVTWMSGGFRQTLTLPFASCVNLSTWLRFSMPQRIRLLILACIYQPLPIQRAPGVTDELIESSPTAFDMGTVITFPALLIKETEAQESKILHPVSVREGIRIR